MTANADLRTFPTADRFSIQAEGFDRLQETSLDIGEPVAILFEHPARPWLYVQTYHYRGWVHAAAVARIPTRKAWLAWVNPAHSLTSLQPQAKLPAPNTFLRMGARLPAAEAAPAIALLPQKDLHGELAAVRTPIDQTTGLASAPLPYTRQAIIQQALRYYGTPYGWGDEGDGVDCSGLIVRVFRSVGLSLPRNADEQEAAPGWKIDLSGKTTQERCSVLDELPPGSTLHIDGHVMLYLGKSAGEYWAIHAYTGHMEQTNTGSLVYRPVMRVTISPLSLLRSNGHTFLDSLTSVRQWLPTNQS